MKKRKPVFTIFQKLYGLLERRQKVIFLIIVLIMILSAGLSQMTPSAIGWLTDDILSHERISFLKVIPFLVFILMIRPQRRRKRREEWSLSRCFGRRCPILKKT